MLIQEHRNKYEPLDKFPGWDRANDFLKSIIVEQKRKVVGDIGGGRMPRVDLDFVRKNKIDYHLIDISAQELSQADAGYHKIQMDVACDDASFAAMGLRTDFDLLYSHMLLEHLLDPMQAHRNFFKMLRPGGLSVHMFPSRNNFPLFVNGLIPEAVSSRLLKILQPHRDTAGQEGKFKAYYRHCGAPTATLRKRYEDIGFEVMHHTSYVGHEYYDRIPPLAAIERQLRKVIVKAELPIITANLLILRKPDGRVN
jgi:SAM-dependent methyltransferase